MNNQKIASRIREWLNETVGRQATKITIVDLPLIPDYVPKGTVCLAFSMSGHVQSLEKGFSRNPRDTSHITPVVRTETASETEVVQRIKPGINGSDLLESDWVFEYSMQTISGEADDYKRAVISGYVYLGVDPAVLDEFVANRAKVRRDAACERLIEYVTDCMAMVQESGHDIVGPVIHSLAARLRAKGNENHLRDLRRQATNALNEIFKQPEVGAIK
jgi:hypothetical protein